MKKKVVTRKQLNKYLFWYKSFFCKNVEFHTSDSDEDTINLVNGLNIKNRKERIKFVRF